MTSKPPSELPFDPLGFDHAVLWVGDLEKARRWYRDVLGCRPGTDYPDIAMTHMWFGAIILGLWDASDLRTAYARPDGLGPGRVDHIALAVSDFDPATLRAHLAAHDVTLEKEVQQTGARGWGHAVYIRDPWGNRIELKGPAPFETPRAI